MNILSEVAYFTDNVPAMTAFYHTLLQTPPAVEAPGLAIFVIGQTKLLIHQTYPPQADTPPPENHLALAVENVDRAATELQARGLTLEIPPRDYEWGRSAYLRDPDGHLLELSQAA